MFKSIFGFLLKKNNNIDTEKTIVIDENIPLFTEFLIYIESKKVEKIPQIHIEKFSKKLANPNLIIKFLLENNYIRKSNYFEKLSKMPMQFLKEILKTKELITSKNKAGLLKIIQENFSTEELEKSFKVDDIFILTEKAQNIIKIKNDKKEKFISENIENLYNFICEKKFIEAINLKNKMFFSEKLFINEISLEKDSEKTYDLDICNLINNLEMEDLNNSENFKEEIKKNKIFRYLMQNGEIVNLEEKINCTGLEGKSEKEKIDKYFKYYFNKIKFKKELKHAIELGMGKCEVIYIFEEKNKREIYNLKTEKDKIPILPLNFECGEMYIFE